MTTIMTSTLIRFTHQHMAPRHPGIYLNNSIAYIIHCKTENTIFVNEKASITKTKQITIKHN